MFLIIILIIILYVKLIIIILYVKFLQKEKKRMEMNEYEYEKNVSKLNVKFFFILQWFFFAMYVIYSISIVHFLPWYYLKIVIF